MNVPQHSLEVQNALKPREITGDLYQRSRPAVVSDKKKRARTVDKCSTGVMYVQYGRLLAYAYDPRGCMWHVQARPYGSSRQQDVDIRDERARLSSRMRKRSGEVVVSTTDDVSRCRRIDSGYPRASCRSN
jgi:hypothetical protein